MTIKRFRPWVIRVEVIGETPLIQCAVTPADESAVIDTTFENLDLRIDEKTLDYCIQHATYKTAAGKHCMPAVAFKSAMSVVAKRIKGVAGTEVDQLIHVLGEHVEIVGPEPIIGPRVIRKRDGNLTTAVWAEFKTWSVSLVVKFNPTSGQGFTVEDIVNLLYNAGALVGVGIRRPEKKGQNGLFTVGNDVTVLSKPD